MEADPSPPREARTHPDGDAARATRSLELLARAGLDLAASLDVEVTLRTVTRLLVPELADEARVYLRDDGGATRLAASAGVPDEREPRSGERSVVTVPLAVAGRTFGAIALAAGEGRRPYDALDRKLADDLARRAALALDNARLFEAAQRERRSAEEASRARDEFLATVSHELRTPISAVLGWVQLLRGGAVPADQQARAIETIERNTRAQVHLIEDILDFSRIVAGRLRLAAAPVDLVGVVEAAIDTVRPAAEARGVRVLASLDPDAGALRGDASRLQQVAWNLLSNAVKFTPRGGRVFVRLTREGAHVELAVADTGQGIDPRFLPRVFDRFAQQETSAARRQGGLGLGLAIARHLVELHGGTVRAESDGEGHGATFVVRLPMAPPAPVPTPPTALPAARPSLPGAPGLRARRVLVVDDEPDARELIRAILESGGASVDTAASAEEAFAALRASPPDVLVSDVGMPREDGYSLIKRVRALSIEQGGRTPAVALTAYARAEDRARALAAGFDHHVTKPVEPQELLLVVADLAPGPARP